MSRKSKRVSSHRPGVVPLSHRTTIAQAAMPRTVHLKPSRPLSVSGPSLLDLLGSMRSRAVSAFDFQRRFKAPQRQISVGKAEISVGRSEISDLPPANGIHAGLLNRRSLLTLPKPTKLCVRRSIRRQVILAGGYGGKNNFTHYVRTKNSELHCRR